MLHASPDKSGSLKKVDELLTFFDIQPARQRAGEYPHQYSGGMRQRALMAMGTSTRPKLLIADEPTKGIDNSRKKQAASMFRRIRAENTDLSVLLITHDLLFAQALCQRIAVMYCGQIVEISPADTFFKYPAHPYSKALLESLPSRGLKSIPGEMPSMISPPPGCRFHSRCTDASDKCRLNQPAPLMVRGTTVRCWRYA
jgi:peptide/nickel transport system ATP-binding protein